MPKNGESDGRQQFAMAKKSTECAFGLFWFRENLGFFFAPVLS